MHYYCDLIGSVKLWNFANLSYRRTQTNLVIWSKVIAKEKKNREMDKIHTDLNMAVQHAFITVKYGGKIWAALRKMSLMSWVVVIPKEGFWYDTDFLDFFWKNFFFGNFCFYLFIFFFFKFFFQVGVIPKEGWTGYLSILLLVWQWLRTLGYLFT